jgi:hypothetical protein
MQSAPFNAPPLFITHVLVHYNAPAIVGYGLETTVQWADGPLARCLESAAQRAVLSTVGIFN